MRRILLLSFSLILGVMAWVGTDHLWISLGFVAVSLLDCFFYWDPKFERRETTNLKKHECFQFVNSFIIALSVKKTLGNAYQTIVQQTTGGLADELRGNQHLNTSEALECLMSYFGTPSYALFLNIIRLYEQQGGDILLMGEFLVHEVRREEEKLTLTEVMVRRKLTNFVVLWMMTLVILLFCRFGISSFYHQMLGNPIFILMMVVFLGFLLVSFHVFFQLMIKKEKSQV